MGNLALLGAVFLFTNLALASTAEASGCGAAEVVKGKVEVKRGGGAATALTRGEKVCAGDVVTTAAESRVKLAMEDGNVLNVNPGSSLKIEAYVNDAGSAKKKVLLNVMYGKMRATVNQTYDGKSASGEPQLFQVKTKSAVAGVRGTDFLTSFSPKTNKMEVVTFEGKVEVGQAGPGGVIMNSVAVGAGMKTEAAVGQPPAPPKAVPAAELKQMDSGSQSGSAGERPQPNANAGSEGGDKDKDKDKGEKKGPEDQAKNGPEDQKKDNGKKGPGGEKRVGNEGNKGDGSKDGGDGRAPAAAAPASGGGDTNSGSRPTAGPAPGPAPGSAPSPGIMPPPSGGMMMPIDTDLMAGGPMMPAPGGTMPPPMFIPPTMPVYQPPTCEFCNQAIQTGPAKVNIKICLPNQGC